jgi:ABC-type arginine transport system ATPase subunit
MDLIQANKARLQKNLDLYRRRQTNVEHPFGVIKRQWDFYYIMTKGSIKQASSNLGMICTAYNLWCAFNILHINLLKAYLRGLGLYFGNFRGDLLPFA